MLLLLLLLELLMELGLLLEKGLFCILSTLLVLTCEFRFIIREIEKAVLKLRDKNDGR